MRSAGLGRRVPSGAERASGSSRRPAVAGLALLLLLCPAHGSAQPQAAPAGLRSGPKAPPPRSVPLGAVRLYALDGDGRVLDLAVECASIQRTPPRRADPG